MLIKEDYSYIGERGQNLISEGYAELGIYSLNFARYFTEEEKKNNRNLAETMTSEQWDIHCDNTSKALYGIMFSIAEMLNREYIMYQFDKNVSHEADWDLFFYSNKGWNNKDYFDYMQINFNRKRSTKQNLRLKDEIVKMLADIEVKNVYCGMQHYVIYNDEKIKLKARENFEKYRNKFISYKGMTGKIKETEKGQYGFFKKGAYKNYYLLSNIDVILI